MHSAIPLTKLSDGTTIPQLGFGVFLVPPDEAATAVATALEVGYRGIDTAAAYGNEAGVGEAVRSSGLDRDEVYVTTKVWNNDQGYDKTMAAFDASMAKLGLDRLDLYLIHWPTPARELYVDTWKALRALREDGRVTSIGVCNFHIPHLRRLHEETGLLPVLNQVELHPRLPQTELRAFHAEHGIATEAWSPLARGRLLDDPSLRSLATKYGKTTAQVILRWHLQLGNVVIPKSVTPARIAENYDVLDFELGEEDFPVFAALENGERVGPNPEEFNKG